MTIMENVKKALLEVEWVEPGPFWCIKDLKTIFLQTCEEKADIY